MTDARLGANILGQNKVEFRLWAPESSAVTLLVDDQKIPMLKDDAGVFSCLSESAPGSEYRYLIDHDHIVPDPASRLQSGDVHDASMVYDPSYPWRNINWNGRPWEDAVIYELHAGIFGGFSGIQKQLARLASIGITAVELMPIADFPGNRNWGYDGVLPYAPDTAYGTPNELKAMIDEAHGLGLQVFLDVVYNHFGPDGNYLSVYAGKFFRNDLKTPWGDAIDFRQPMVRRFFIENALLWLNEYRFDGLRFDAVHAIPDRTFLTELAGEIRDRTKGRFVHLVLENENNDAQLLCDSPGQNCFDAQWNDDWHHCLHVLLTGESESYYGDFQSPAEKLARCLDQGFAYQGEPSLHANGKPRGTPSGQLPSTAFVNCLQNHDQVGNRAMGERITTLANPAALRAAITLLLLCPQIPMIFMGEEWGETKPFLFFTDYHDELADAVRQGRREEFSKFEAFQNPQKRRLIPDPNDPATFAASVPEFDAPRTNEQMKTLELYRQLLAIRQANISRHLAGTISLGARTLGDSSVYAQWRLGNNRRLTIAANFGDSEVACPEVSMKLLFHTGAGDVTQEILPSFTTLVWIEEP